MQERQSERHKKPAKETLRSNIKDYIQQKIAEGIYRPGDRIVETQLARELNVSQAPVRRRSWNWPPSVFWKSGPTQAASCGS